MSEEIFERVPIPKAKRIFDIIMVFTLVVILSPLIFLIILWIFVEQIIIPASRGSIFYCETRISAARLFKFYKFRIFKQKIVDRERKKHSCIHTKPLEGNIKNLTYYGRFLKQIYMDELPQLINVIRGDMTLVGPRPTNVEVSDQIKKLGDYTKEKMVCGITGSFQAQKGGRGNQRKLDEDYINYVASNPGWKVVIKDLKIIFKTIQTIFKAEGI